MNYEIIPVQPNTQEWLDLRKKGIGGSDAAAAVGQSKWKTPYQVWLDKTGRDDGGFNMDWWTAQVGHALEPKIIEWYAREYKAEMEIIHGICRSTKYPFMQCTPDAIIHHNDDRTGFNAKKYLSKGAWGAVNTDEVPHDYLYQAHHEMIILGLERYVIAVSFFGTSPVIYCVEADKGLHEIIIEHEAALWERIQRDVEPELKTAEDVLLKYPTSKSQIISANDIDATACADLKAIKAQIKTLEKQEEELATRLKKLMGDNDTLNYLGDTLATWKSTTPGMRFDLEHFKALNPALYNQYLVRGFSQRRFLLK